MSAATLERPLDIHQEFEIRRFDAPLGAEIVGLDLNKPVSAAELARIRKALVEHGVVVFRDQRITPQQHVDFSRRFGPLQVHVLNRFHLAGHPEIHGMDSKVSGPQLDHCVAIGLLDD